MSNKGSWHVGLAGVDVGYPTSGVYVVNSIDEKIAWVENSSNAYAIAAVPELMEALQAMVSQGRMWFPVYLGGPAYEDLDRACKAIAKALGRIDLQ